MILEIENIGFSYKSVPVLKNISFKVEKGEILCILGNNGAGKSTLLKCINRILKPKEGAIYLDKKDLSSIKRKDLAKIIGYVSQKYDYTNLTVFDAILLGRRPYIKWDVSQKDMEVVRNIIERLNLEDLALRNINEISGGELQKVIIARALAQEPKILLLDEPTNNLDLKNQIEVLSIVKEHVKTQDILAIIVLHDLNLAFRFSDKFIFLKNGTIFSYGDINSINEEVIKEVYGIPVILEKVRGIPIVIPM
uniref:ABC transporter ATP-binding protein n=1 Tax=Dictyoglomus thermophilum TaxID=14 RepID=A0A7C3RMD0_DICTH